MAQPFAKVPPPLPGNVWLIFSFPESGLGFLTAEMFPRIPQEREPWDALWPQRVADRRARFVRTIFEKALAAVADCHDAGVAHGSISPASITGAPFDQRDPRRLIIQLQDFGFSTQLPGVEPKRRSELIRDDLYALAYAYLQLLFSSLTTSPNEDDGVFTPASGMIYDQETLRDIFERKFKMDFKGAGRDWAYQREEWEHVCKELDGPDDTQEGWKLLHAMINCRGAASRSKGGVSDLSAQFVSARNLLASPYFLVER
eukprot:scaffold2677_cov220-Pinguiococcus_pyrenoidosus.AAC.4